MSARALRNVETIGSAPQRVSGRLEVAIDREAELSNDLTQLIGHRCLAIILTGQFGRTFATFELTPGGARELAIALNMAADQWTDPLEQAVSDE